MIYEVVQVMVDLYVVQNKTELLALRGTCVGARDALKEHPYVKYIISKYKRSMNLDRALQRCDLRWKSFAELKACPIGRNAIRGFTEGRMDQLDHAVSGLALLDLCMNMHAKSRGCLEDCAEPAARERIQHLLKMFDYAKHRITHTLIVHLPGTSSWTGALEGLEEDEIKHTRSYTAPKERALLLPPKAKAKRVRPPPRKKRMSSALGPLALITAVSRTMPRTPPRTV